MKSREQISYNMSRVRSTGSVIESRLGRAMWATGLRYRKQYVKMPGRPDFVIVRSKIAVFCDSSFWHGRNWPRAAQAIKSNREFWIPKIERNIARDKAVNRALRELGWKVLRFWDDQIFGGAERCAQRVLDAVNKSQKYGARQTRSPGRGFLLRRGRHDERPDKSRHTRPGRRRQRVPLRGHLSAKQESRRNPARVHL